MLFLLLSINKTFSQREHVLSHNTIIKNKISEVQIFNVDTPKNYLFQHIFYNNFGNLLTDIFFNKDGSLWIKNSYQYNEKQQLVSSLDEIKNIITKYKYDESGNKIESITVKSDSTILYHDKMIYNEKNQIIKIFSKKKNSDFYYLKENRFYTDNGLESKRDNFKESEKLSSVEVFEYDKKQNLIFLFRTINGEKTTTKFSYNKKDELIKTEYPTGISIEYKYDEFGNRISEIAYSKKVLSFKLPNREYKYKKIE